MEKLNDPLLSVVVPSYNSECYIRECLESLRATKSYRVEYILIDGGSTDNTMSIVEDFRDIFSVIISEKDKGQSDAFNKGFALAKGEYLTWLNSDDIFCSGALAFTLDWIEREERPWYAANVAYINEQNVVTKCCQSGSFEKWGLAFGILNVFGPSTIFSRKLFQNLGGFREDFHYSMDTEYWWRIAQSGVQYQRIPVYLWALRLHDGAKTAAVVTQGPSARPPRMVEEGRLSRRLYFPNVSMRSRKIATWLIKLWRIFNLSYIKSYIATVRNRDKHISCMRNPF